MPITARYRVDKTEKRQPRRKGKHLRLHNVCPLLRHPQNDADLEPHPQVVLFAVVCILPPGRNYSIYTLSMVVNEEIYSLPHLRCYSGHCA